MSSAERMIKNVDEDTSEGLLRSKKKITFQKEEGIQVKNICSRYRSNLPLVLKGLSLKVNSGQKVALVGRTGSGKSSFILALTRILNVENSKYYEDIRRVQNIEDSHEK
jgi:ABC-type multidrug transport system fused ATPase/permease subunit